MPERGDTIQITGRKYIIDGYDNEHNWVDCHGIGHDARPAIHTRYAVRDHATYIARADGQSITVAAPEAA